MLVHEDIEISLVVFGLRDRSFELKYEFKSKDGETKAVAKTVHVFVKVDGFQKCELTNELKKALSANQK